MTEFWKKEFTGIPCFASGWLNMAKTPPGIRIQKWFWHRKVSF